MSTNDNDYPTWTLQLSPTGDLDINDQQRFTTVSGDNAVLQDLKVAMLSFKGEDGIDPDFGFDFFRAVPHEAALKREIRRTLEYDDYRHARVESVTALEVLPHPGRRENVEVRAKVKLVRPSGETTTEQIEFTLRQP